MRVKSIGAATAVLGWLLQGCDPAPENGVTSAYREVSEPDAQAASHDFGLVNAGERVNVTFEYVNETPHPQSLRARGSCGCEQLSLDRDVLDPGEAANLSVTIDTTNLGGYASASVEILSDGRVVKTYGIIGNVVPGARLIVSPRRIDVGGLEVGQTRSIPLVMEIIRPGLEPGDYEFSFEYSVLPEVLAIDVELPSSAPRIVADPSRGVVEQSYDAGVRVSALLPARLQDGVIRFTAKEKIGGLVSQGILPLSGEVRGPMTISPTTVFLGTVRPEEALDFTLDVVLEATLEGMPRLEQNGASLRLLKVTGEQHRYRLHLQMAAPGTEGIFQLDVRIVWDGRQSAPIKVVGSVAKP